MFPLDNRIFAVGHVVAQVIEAELVVRAVGDIRFVRFFAAAFTQKFIFDLKRAELIALLIGLFACLSVARRQVARIVQIGSGAAVDHADRQAEKRVNLPHPYRVAAGKVIVDGHHMDAFAGKRV